MIPNFRNKSLSHREELLDRRQTFIELVDRHDSNFNRRKKTSYHIDLDKNTNSDHQCMILSDLSEKGRMAR